MFFIKIAFSSFSISPIKTAKILKFFCLAKSWKGAVPINTRSSSLVSSIGSAGLGVIAGLRIRLAGTTTYFSLSLSASLLTPWYAGRTPGIASGILIGFDFFNYFNNPWGSAGAVALVLRCNSTNVLFTNNREPGCWQCSGQKVSLSQLMSRMTLCFCIQGLLKINGYWPSFVIRNRANNLVWLCAISVE